MNVNMSESHPVFEVVNPWAWLSAEAILMAVICCEILPRLLE